MLGFSRYSLIALQALAQLQPTFDDLLLRETSTEPEIA